MSNDLIKYNIKETTENNNLNNNNNNDNNNHNNDNDINNNDQNNNQENIDQKDKKKEESLNLILLENEIIDGDADKFKDNEKEESTSKNSDKMIGGERDD